MFRWTRPSILIGLILFGALSLWAYWPTLEEVAEKWATHAMYSHGYLVPAFSLFLLYFRRQKLEGVTPQPNPWGLPVLVVGVALHLAGTYYYFDYISALSLLPVLAGLALCLGGLRVLAWTWPSVAFLAFMLPLPHQLEVALGSSLQRLATVCSTFLLQTIGFAAVSEGNTIIMEEARVGVVEACNGLGMLLLFFAMTTGTAIVVRRPLLDRLVIVLSAVPISLLANIIRITITAMLAEWLGGSTADLLAHYWGGWLMMPLALVMLWVEVKILDRLLVERLPEKQLEFTLTVPGPTEHAGVS